MGLYDNKKVDTFKVEKEKDNLILSQLNPLLKKKVALDLLQFLSFGPSSFKCREATWDIKESVRTNYLSIFFKTFKLLTSTQKIDNNPLMKSYIQQRNL